MATELKEDIVMVENLTTWVSKRLEEMGHPEPTRWESRKAVMPETHPGEPLPAHMQIIQINRALRYILSECELNTFDLRMMIFDTPDINHWKSGLEDGGVLEFIALNNV